MLYSCTSNSKINLLHERAVRMVYNDRTSSFEDIYIKDNSFTVHDFIIQSLATEIIKLSNNITPTIIDDLFTRSHHSYSLCSIIFCSRYSEFKPASYPLSRGIMKDVKEAHRCAYCS